MYSSWVRIRRYDKEKQSETEIVALDPRRARACVSVAILDLSLRTLAITKEGAEALETPRINKLHSDQPLRRLFQLRSVVLQSWNRSVGFLLNVFGWKWPLRPQLLLDHHPRRKWYEDPFGVCWIAVFFFWFFWGFCWLICLCVVRLGTRLFSNIIIFSINRRSWCIGFTRMVASSAGLSLMAPWVASPPCKWAPLQLLFLS